jgi:hypothetical protein
MSDLFKSNLTDANGVAITIGATAVVLGSGMNKGSVGTVHAIKDDRIRVGAGDPMIGPHFSSWCRAKEIAIVNTGTEKA